MPILDTHIRPMQYREMSYYPHMSSEDTDLWTRFIRDAPDWGSLVWYDFPVGSIPNGIAAEAAHIGDNYGVKTYSKRVDVVAPIGNVVYVIELKPHASAIALGQALLYSHCIRTVIGPGVRAAGMIITDHADPDLLVLAPTLGIKIIELDSLGGKGVGG